MCSRNLILNQDDMEHLKYLQDIIKRMADNSFKIKGWSITITGGLLALLISNPKASTKDFLVVLIPIIGFWLIDSYYLMLERIFRNRYEKDVQLIKDKNYDEIKYLSFGKVYEIEKFKDILNKIDIGRSWKTFLNYINSLFSMSLLLTYGPMILCVFFIKHVLS